MKNVSPTQMERFEPVGLCINRDRRRDVRGWLAKRRCVSHRICLAVDYVKLVRDEQKGSVSAFLLWLSVDSA
jgi:hypothetical protein